mgnify:CR=1 FL=1
MAGGYDFQALKVIFELYNLDEEEKEEIIVKLIAISTANRELEEQVKKRQEQIDAKFENKPKRPIGKR